MAKEVNAEPLDKRDRSTSKSRKIAKIGICFSLRENRVVSKGRRWVYIRVAGPDGMVLTNSTENIFELDDKQIVYTARKQVDYAGQDLDDCIYWQTGGGLAKGK